MNNTLEPQELAQAITKLTSICGDMRGHLLRQAKDAAESGETGWLLTVSSSANEVDDCVTKLESIGSRLREILMATLGFEDGGLDAQNISTSANHEPANDSTPSRSKRLRRIRTAITEGEIRQNLLTLTAERKRGLVRLGEHFKFRLPDGQAFETELVHPGNRLRERGWIREFYRQQDIKAGDFVLLEEVEPGIWTLNRDTATPTTTSIAP